MFRLRHKVFFRAFARFARVAAWSAVAWTTIASSASWPTTIWPESAPETQGVDSVALREFHESLAASGASLDCVLLIRHGYVVSEVYFAPYRPGIPHDLRSVTKTVVGMLVGAAIQQKDIRSVDQRMATLLPQKDATDARKSALTIGHLLDMRTGIQWREWPYDSRSDVMRMAASRNWVEYILDRPMMANPGETFQYTGAAAHLLSAILTRATGEPAAAYAGVQLFGPLGIHQYDWLKDPQGNSIGESGLSLTPRDLAKLGYLHLRDGVWEGRRLLPQDWVRRIFAQAVPHGLRTSRLAPAYHALWWVDGSEPMAIAAGRHGQTLLILPEQDVVLVLMGKTNDDSGLDVPTLVRARLLPAFHPQSLPQNIIAQRALRNKEAQLSALTVMPGVAVPRTSGEISGRRFLLGPNGQRIHSIRVELPDRGAATFTIAWQSTTDVDGEAPFTRPFGKDGRFTLSEPTAWGIFASRGRWIDARTLLIQSEALQSSTMTSYQFRFTDGAVELIMTDNDGMNERLMGRARENSQ